MKKILCILGFHDWKIFNVNPSPKNIFTYYKCSRCTKKKIDWVVRT